MGTSITINLNRYVENIIHSFRQNLELLSTWFNSVHLAVANYDPEQVQNGTCLFTIGSSPTYCSDQVTLSRLYPLAQGTEEFVTRMAILSLISVVDEALRQALLPYQAVKDLTCSAQMYEKAEFEHAAQEQDGYLSKATFGRALILVKEAVFDIDEDRRGDNWDLNMDRLEEYRRLRNCLAHRLGRVSELDVNSDDNCLKITWQAKDICRRGPDSRIPDRCR